MILVRGAVLVASPNSTNPEEIQEKKWDLIRVLRLVQNDGVHVKIQIPESIDSKKHGQEKEGGEEEDHYVRSHQAIPRAVPAVRCDRFLQNHIQYTTDHTVSKVISNP